MSPQIRGPAPPRFDLKRGHSRIVVPQSNGSIGPEDGQTRGSHTYPIPAIVPLSMEDNTEKAIPMRCWKCDGILSPETAIDRHSAVSVQLLHCLSCGRRWLEGKWVRESKFRQR